MTTAQSEILDAPHRTTRKPGRPMESRPMNSKILDRPPMHNADEIQRALGLLLAPDDVVELRVLEARTTSYRNPHVESGYFDDWGKLVEAAATIGKAKGWYVCLNPVNPALLARAANRIRPVGKEPTTSDSDILQRRWLPIDLDAVRPAGISATDEEHKAALDFALLIRDCLAAMGWPEPILADSGNGAHLLYRVDLPADDGGLVERCLKSLVAHFGARSDEVDLDTTVHNPARIWKLYGTLACKGDSTVERPHRLARLLAVPSTIEAVPSRLLEALAGSATVAEPSATRQAGNGHFNLDEWIARHGLQVDGPQPWRGSGRRWVFSVCPWNPEHRNRSAFIVQWPDGTIGAGCQHNGCAEKGWHDLRDVVEPGWREQRAERGNGVKGVYGVAPQRRKDEQEDPWPDPIDQAAYHGLAGQIVHLIEPHSEADPVAILAQCLVAFGSVIGRTAHFLAEADTHYSNLFITLVGTTSKGRKGTSWGQTGRVFGTVDQEWYQERVMGGLSSGEGLIWAVRDPIYKTENIKEKGRTVDTQEVLADAGVADKRLLALESEFGSVLKVIGRERNTLSAIIRQAWDTGTRC